jgi:hypothetical protein
MNFITDNKHFQINADVHSVDTRTISINQLLTSYNLSCIQKSTYYARIKMLNNLPPDLESLMNEKARFKIALK